MRRVHYPIPCYVVYYYRVAELLHFLQHFPWQLHSDHWKFLSMRRFGRTVASPVALTGGWSSLLDRRDSLLLVQWYLWNTFA